MKQVLEELLESYSSLDCRHNMASFDCHECQTYLGRENLPQFFETSLNGFGVSYPDLTPSGDYHETYKVDRYDNVYDGHGTVRGKGGFSSRVADFDKEAEDEFAERNRKAEEFAKMMLER